MAMSKYFELMKSLKDNLKQLRIRQKIALGEKVKNVKKEIFRVRNGLYFVGGGTLSTIGIVLSLRGKQQDDKDKEVKHKEVTKTLNLLKVLLTSLSLQNPSLSTNTYKLMLLEWSSGDFKTRIGILRRLSLVHIRKDDDKSWLSNAVIHEISLFANNNLKQKKDVKSNIVTKLAAGFVVDDDCKSKFSALKGNKCRFIIFKVDREKKKIIVDKVSLETDGFEEFASSLPRDECRFGVFRFEFGAILIPWIPYSANFGSTVLYSGLKTFLRCELDSIMELEASEIGLDLWKDSSLF